MRKALRRRPSAAMIVAIVALVAALGGSAIAGSGFVTKKKFKKFKTQTNTQINTLSSSAVKGPVQYVNASVTTPTPPPPNNGTPISVSCPSGTHVLGGGIKVGREQDSFVNDSHPTPTGWAGTVFTFGTNGGDTATATAICASVNSVSGVPPS